MQLLHDGGAVRRVAHDPEPLLFEPVHDEIVEDPPVDLAHHRVLRLADRQRAGIADECVAQEGDRLLAAHLDLAHVRQVEEPRRAANRTVLGQDALVLDRHLVASERDEPRAEGNVLGVERRAPEFRRLDHAVASARSRISSAASSRTLRSVAWLRTASAS